MSCDVVTSESSHVIGTCAVESAGSDAVDAIPGNCMAKAIGKGDK